MKIGNLSVIYIGWSLLHNGIAVAGSRDIEVVLNRGGVLLELGHDVRQIVENALLSLEFVLFLLLFLLGKVKLVSEFLPLLQLLSQVLKVCSSCLFWHVWRQVLEPRRVFLLGQGVLEIRRLELLAEVDLA